MLVKFLLCVFTGWLLVQSPAPVGAVPSFWHASLPQVLHAYPGNQYTHTHSWLSKLNVVVCIPKQMAYWLHCYPELYFMKTKKVCFIYLFRWQPSLRAYNLCLVCPIPKLKHAFSSSWEGLSNYVFRLEFVIGRNPSILTKRKAIALCFFLKMSYFGSYFGLFNFKTKVSIL